MRRHARLVVRFLESRSPQEREKRAAHAFALLLVCAVATVKYVTGLTVQDAPFTLFVVAIAASAARGGFAPALVATLASTLAGGLGPLPPGNERAHLLFGVEALSVALLVSAIRARVQAGHARLRTAEGTITELRLRDRRRRVLDAALRHLEETAGETAVVVLNDRGVVTEWRTSAERLYGYPAEHVVGASVASLFFAPLSETELWALLHRSEETGSLQRPGVHRRSDGSRLNVDLEIKPFLEVDARGFTLTVHDTARREEWQEYREAATSAQAALQQAADDTRGQLAAIENLTDPSLNPLEGTAMVTELLERLRAWVRADGAALVQRGRVGVGVVAARGLQPVGRPIATEGLRLAPGRVAVVHNDPARVEQLSTLRWSDAVSSLLVVPVVHDGRVWSTIEIVSERSRQVSDWDVALVRIVADRLAAVVVRNGEPAAKAS